LRSGGYGWGNHAVNLALHARLHIAHGLRVSPANYLGLGQLSVGRERLALLDSELLTEANVGGVCAVYPSDEIVDVDNNISLPRLLRQCVHLGYGGGKGSHGKSYSKNGYSPNAVLSFANSVGLARIMSVKDNGVDDSNVVGFGSVNCPFA